MFEFIPWCPDYTTLKPHIPFDNLPDAFLFTLRQGWRSRDCTAEVRTLAWSQCGHSSSLVIDVIQSIVCCWISSLPQEVLFWDSGFPLSFKTNMSKLQFDLESISSWLAIPIGPQVYHRLELSSFTSLNNEFGLVWFGFRPCINLPSKCMWIRGIM